MDKKQKKGNVGVNLVIALFVVIIIGKFVIYNMFIRLPYNKDIPKIIKPHQTGFLINLEGDTTNQEMYKSFEFLENAQVAVKRVWIQQRWVKTGRMPRSGKYLPKQKLILVDRTPITRWWTAEEHTGSSSRDEAITCESKDSISFSAGFTCTAYISPENSARYLYNYRAKKLIEIMDTEIRAEIQKYADSKSQEYILDNLRAKKNEMIYDIEMNIVRLFKKKGITLTTIGMFGGLVYKNSDIQESIDGVFIAQQEEVINIALFEAQDWKNKTINLQAKGEAYQKKTIAKAQADALKMMTEATLKSQKSDLFYQLQQLENRRLYNKRWNGKLPPKFIQLEGTPPMWMMSISDMMATIQK